MTQLSATPGEGAIVHRKVSGYNTAVVLLAALGSVIYGYNSSVIATTIGQPSFYSFFGLSQDPTSPKYTYTTEITGACNGLAQAGGFFGCYLAAWICDRFGRTTSFQVAAVLALIGGAVQAGSQDLPTFLTFRFVAGIGVGMCLTTTPLYQSEMSPPYARGLLVGSHGAFLAIGYNIASWVGLGSFYSSNPAFAWRFPLALQVVFPLMLPIGSFWLPPSPRWLLANGRHDEGLRVLERLHASKDDPDHFFAQAEYAQIESQLRLERQKHNIRRGASVDLPLSRSFVSDLVDLFLHAPYRRRAILGFTIMFGAQCTGVLVINNYRIILFPALESVPASRWVFTASTWPSHWLEIQYAEPLWMVVFSILQRFGRKKPLLIGLSGCTFALTGECIFARYAAVLGASTAVLALAVLFIFLYMPFFSSMIDPNMYIYASEIYPSEIRAIGVAVSMSGQWLATILFLQSAPTAFAKIGYRFYIVFIVCTVCLGLIVYYFFPETKGLSLEEMAGVFGDEVALTLEDALRNDAKMVTSVEQHESVIDREDEKSASARVETTTDHIPKEV